MLINGGGFTMSSDFRLDSVIIHQIGNLDKLNFLDVACGLGKWGFSVRLGWSGNPEYVVGVDAWRPNLENVRRHKIYDDVVLADARHLPFINASFDVVLACEFLINLEKADGITVIKEAERAASRKTIVSVPNRKTTYGVDSENPLEKNISRWSDKDLKNLGYHVTGIGFQMGGKRLSSNILSGITSISALNRFAELIVGTKEL
jgi:ubiquinone/menaquinone biosynthesis C-methylase UbiE